MAKKKKKKELLKRAGRVIARATLVPVGKVTKKIMTYPADVVEKILFGKKKKK